MFVRMSRGTLFLIRITGAIGIIAAVGLAEIAFDADHRVGAASVGQAIPGWTTNQLLVAAVACLLISIGCIIFGSVMDAEY
jgi:hypothetical protein